jgi:hypothetical protein
LKRSLKVLCRALVASAGLVVALLLFGGRAYAQEIAPTEVPEATTPPSGPEPPVAPTPPTAPVEEPIPPTPPGADGPDNTNDQNATVDTNGTAVADTGNNTAEADTTTDTPATQPAGGTSATGTATSGASTSTGNASVNAITQTATAQADGLGAVDILQIALVINLGVSHSGTGSNVVGAVAGPGDASSEAGGSIGTGNATATGNAANTSVIQSAVIQTGETSDQTTAIINVGIALGNSGLNIVIGSVGARRNSTTQAVVSGGVSAGAVATGPASAIGNQSSNSISQLAGGMASDSATLLIDQRAIVVNFGTAYANSGGNFAYGAFDPTGLSTEQLLIIDAILQLLAPLFGSDAAATAETVAGAGGTANASIVTGAATAIGNDSTTSISQSVLGTATGSGVASASQSVAVGNLGLALANTGLNGAIAGGGLAALPGPGAQLATAQSELQQFMNLLTDLAWLTSENPFEQFAQTVHLDGLTLTLGGNIQGSEFLVGWDANLVPEGGPIPGGVRVRQISGVLDIGIAISDSGNNVVIAVVDNDNGAAGTSSDAGPVGLDLSSTMNTRVAAANAFSTPANTALATIDTGDATALGNGALVFVCQTFNDSEACLPEADPPVDTGNPGPSDGPGTVAPGSGREGYVGGSPTDPADPSNAFEADGPGRALEADGSSSAGTLPLTGGDPRGLVGAGLGLVAAGGLLASRRRANRKGLRVVRS